MTSAATPRDPIVEFWQAARGRIKDGGLLAALHEVNSSQLVTPPAWSFGDSPELADELLGLVLSGVKTGTSSVLAEYGPDEPLPQVGELSILLDGAGNPRALIQTTEVVQTTFGAVDAEFAAAEGEGDLSLAHWREGHEAYWRRVLAGLDEPVEFTEALPIITERFKLVL